jgi:hypothetical protein
VAPAVTTEATISEGAGNGAQGRSCVRLRECKEVRAERRERGESVVDRCIGIREDRMAA